MSSSTATLVPTGTWSADPTHSTVGFQVRHMGISTVRGEFGEFEGQIDVPGDDLAAAKVTGSVKVGSVDTKDQKRDDHLRSADFFDADQHPELTFESKAIESVDGESFKVVGDLTLHGVTKEVVLEAEVHGTDEDPWGNQRVGLEITGQLSRGAFGMTFSQALGSGNALVSDKVKLALDISAVKAA